MALIEGRGTTPDEQESLRLLRATAEKDNHEALHRLGVILRQGKHVTKGWERRSPLLTRAAEGGHVPSMLDVAFPDSSAEGRSAARTADLGRPVWSTSASCTSWARVWSVSTSPPPRSIATPPPKASR
jgi:TPR repeat protein